MAGRKSDFTLPTNTLDELFSSQEERDEAKLSKIRDIPLEEIDDFPDHPFQVREDEDMNNGSMFADLEKFKDEDFWREHKTIAFNTLTKKNEYEILAVFKTVVYTDSPEAFKYYRFTDAQSPEEFETYIEKCKELSLYDTGVSAEYGDKLITLSTCEYSRTNGRLVVVAKKVTESSGANAPANDGAAEIPS